MSNRAALAKEYSITSAEILLPLFHLIPTDMSASISLMERQSVHLYNLLVSLHIH
jgi:hypothetical protein